MRLLLLLKAWWQQKLPNPIDDSPYLLMQDEWNFVKAQEEARLQIGKALKAKSHGDNNSKLDGFGAGSNSEPFGSQL